MRRSDTLAVEEPLEIRVGGTALAVTMRTPGNDVELPAGFLVSEGVISRGDQFRSAIHCGGPGTGARSPASRSASPPKATRATCSSADDAAVHEAHDPIHEARGHVDVRDEHHRLILTDR